MAGSIVSISVDGRSFAATADGDGSTKLGGYENEFSPNGDGTGRIIQTRIGWSFAGIDVAIDADREDQEYLTEIQRAGKSVPVKIEYAGGDVKAGSGTITGAIEVSSMSGTASLTFEGPGELKAQ